MSNPRWFVVIKGELWCPNGLTLRNLETILNNLSYRYMIGIFGGAFEGAMSVRTRAFHFRDLVVIGKEITPICSGYLGLNFNLLFWFMHFCSKIGLKLKKKKLLY